MSAITRLFSVELRERLVRLALDGLSSPSTLRAYSAAIDEFLTWAPYQPTPEFSKALVQQYKSMLIEKELPHQVASGAAEDSVAGDDGVADHAAIAGVSEAGA